MINQRIPTKTIDSSTSKTEAQSTTFNTTCCYCGVGCGVTATLNNNQLIAVQGDENHPANFGRLCVKGSALHETQNNKNRLLTPQLHGQPSSWDEALNYSVDKFKTIIAKHGPSAVAFYLSGQLLTEDYYVANKLMKGFIGSANVDTNSRLCMASATVAHKRAFGGDIVPGCYEDLELADLLLIVGSNLAYAHPITYQRVAQAKKQNPRMKVVVIDPRRTATCDIADIHLPIRPGSDAFLFNGMLSYLATHQGLDNDFIAQHCDNAEETIQAALTQVGNPATAATFCDVDLEDLTTVYDWFMKTDKAVTVFSQGINQSSSGVDKGNAIINCHLASGKIGKPGATPFSITGQPNAMGGREVGGLANQLAAHMGFDNEADIERVARFWNAPNMAVNEGRKAVDMFQDIYAGKIKAIWIMATNPAATMPDASLVQAALERCELVMVSDCVADTDTAKFAHVLLPTSTWGEKTGMVTNSERRMSLQKGMLPVPGEAKHDWQIMTDFAHKLGFHKDFAYQHPVDIFREHAQLSGFENSKDPAHRRRAFDISIYQNISLADYDNFTPIQWPVTTENPTGLERFFTEGDFFTDNNNAKLIPVTARFPQMPAKEGQVIMNTGRIRDHWHTMSRTGSAAKLFGHCEEPFVDIHPEDMKRWELKTGDLIQLENRKTRYIGRAQAHSGQRIGEVFVPMHWNKKFAASSCADTLVNPYTDPLCGQPEFKHSPVAIKPYPAAWRGFLIVSDHCNFTTPATDYWANITISGGQKFKLGDKKQPTVWGQEFKSQFPAIQDWSELNDSAQSFYAAAGFKDGKLVVLFHAQSGPQEIKEIPWLEQQLNTICDLNTRFALLAGKPGEGIKDEGKIICSCFQIGENTIRDAIQAGCETAETLGEKLKCGTNCGSCIPELNSLVHDATKILDKTVKQAG